MRLAVRTAEEGVRGGGFPFGAAIVRGGEVIAVVGNSVQRDADPTAHAEMQAIRGACRKLNSRDLSACTIYATGEPCPMCFSACFWARIPRIVFGATLEEIRKAGVRQLMVSTRQMKAAGKVEIESSGGCLREENLALLRLWSKQPRP
jgi:guanine deaminase